MTEVELVGIPDGPPVFVPQFGQETPTFKTGPTRVEGITQFGSVVSAEFMSLSTITRKDMGMSMSAAVRRLVLIGARCEAEHGRSTMSASYNDLHTGSKEFNDEFYGEREEPVFRQQQAI
jgi:hypothetical protein